MTEFNPNNSWGARMIAPWMSGKRKARGRP